VNKKKLSIVAILAAIGGVLYRLGGKEGFDTKFRDIGCNLVSILPLALFGGINSVQGWLSLLGVFALTFGALTTYRYFLPKPKTWTWPYYAMHGFFVAFAALPYAWFTNHWLWFGVSCILCAAGVGAWSHFISWDELEEGGRGVIIVLTRALLVL
jgi:hypothetical protein